VLLCAQICLFAACAGHPAGADYPRPRSVALEHPEGTRLGGQFGHAAQAHGGSSGFRLITGGVDGFLARAQMIDAAEQTLDLQYYIFRGDETGRLLTDALLRAADRGVRVRVLVDDGDTVAGDEQLLALNAHRAIEIRIFNPFTYRGHSKLRRAIEFLFNASRLDYRMHNKLLVVDNSIALVGGRNVGNPYFQMDPDSQFADDDVVAAGPIARQLSATFDEYWNSRFAIPAAALQREAPAHTEMAAHRERARSHPTELVQPSATGGGDYVTQIATGEPYAGLISGRLPLIWADAQVVCDSPDKRRVIEGEQAGKLMTHAVLDRAGRVQSELLMITPYFVPTDGQLQVVKSLRERGVPVRVLTNSLESARDLLPQAGYMHFRKPLLEQGVELYEARSKLGNAKGSGQTTRLSLYGHYGLHAKLLVFDRDGIFIGSMNFDQRSRRLNTEIGLIIESPELAVQTAGRFGAMTQPANAYALMLRQSPARDAPAIVWRTDENGAPVEYTREPSPSEWRRIEAGFFSLLPIAREL
jgi:putative cardiolipin synthase